MAFNGTGTFDRIYNWVIDKNNSVPITASRMDTEMDGMATGLSTCITKDGQTTITANIPMNTKKFTGLNVGNARTDSIALSQVQDNQFLDAGTTGGSADAYTITLSPAITAYVATMQFAAKIHAINTTTTPYLQFNSIANPSSTAVIKKLNLSGTEIAVEAGDLVGNHQFKRNSANDAWIVLDPKKPYLNLVNSSSSNEVNNLIINGDFRIAQRGTTFDSTTTPANSDDTFLLDRWNLVSDGNDIVDVSQETTTVPTGSYSSIKMDQETANKQWGLVQFLEHRDAAAIIGGTASLSFSARKGGSNATVGKLRAAIISWSSTADTLTSDVVGTWAGAGTNPTLATNWTYENTPSDLTLTTSFQTFKIENISIDTASTKNVAVFIWLDDTNGTVADLVYISNVKLEKGSVSTPYLPRLIEQEQALCERYYQLLKYNMIGNTPGAQADGAGFTFSTTMRTTPTVATVTAPSLVNCSGVTYAPVSDRGIRIYITSSGAVLWTVDQGVASLSAEL